MKTLLFASIAIATLAAIQSPAHASSLIGSQVTATVDYPTLGTALTIPVTQTVGSGVEFTSGSLQLLPSLGGTYIIGVNIDVGASSIDFGYTQGATSLVAPFNGYVFDFDSSSPVITGVTLDPLSTFIPGQIGLSFGPHEVAVNVEGLEFDSSSRIRVDTSFASSSATPEPYSYALLLAGLVLLLPGILPRRKEKGCMQ